MGLIGNEITLASQICSVVDIHDAMTCRRPYRDALDLEFTLDHLKSQGGDRLDSEIVRTWIEMAPGLVRQQDEYFQEARALADAAISGKEPSSGGGGS